MAKKDDKKSGAAISLDASNEVKENSEILENSFYELGMENKIRQTFRVPVEEKDNIKIVYDDIEYDVVDLATKGIGVRTTKLDKFSVGDILKPIRVVIKDKTFRLEGEVVHVTPETADTSICGIKFINMSPESRTMLLEYLQKNGSFGMETVF
jgi:hypothetical protein